MPTQGDFVGMKEIYGHESAFNLPLEVVARELGEDQDRSGNRGDIESWETRYASWLQDSEFGHLICFVDITFAPVGATRATREVTTLIVGSSFDQREEYRRRLTDYLQIPASLNAHPVFGDGLPSFESDGRYEAPETGDQLRRMRGAGWKLKDDRYLLWIREPIQGEAEALLQRRPPSKAAAFSAKFVQTFKEPINELKIPSSISKNWEEYVSKMTQPRMRTELRAAGVDGHGSEDSDLDKIGIVVAAPIGIRSQRTKTFVRVADVFFGLSRRTTRRTAEEFLRFLALHLLRSNAGFNQQIRASKRLLGLIGHEVKKVAVTITEEWAPKAEKLFEITTPNVEPSERKDDNEPVSLGRIELKPEFEFLKSDLGILPFRSQLQVTSRSLRFWSYTNKVTDQPFPETHRSPETWAKLIDACWEGARQQIILFALGRNSANTPASIHKRWEEINDFADLLGKRPIVDWSPIRLQRVPCLWTGTDEKVKYQVNQSFALSRILIALFGNCLQHGDPFGEVKMGVHSSSGLDDEFQIWIENAPYREQRDPLMNPRMKRVLKLISDAKEFSRGMVLLEGSTVDVVDASLEELGGGNLKLGENGSGSYSAIFAFRWRMLHD